jgi:hypothetical protein
MTLKKSTFTFYTPVTDQHSILNNAVSTFEKHTIQYVFPVSYSILFVTSNMKDSHVCLLCYANLVNGLTRKSDIHGMQPTML